MNTDHEHVETNLPSPSPNPAILRLAVFVGEWTWEASIDGNLIGNGRAVFEWLEGGAFLLQREDAEQSDFPASTGIIACDDAADAYCQCYFDSRGIARIYQMSLSDGVWKLWRDASGFAQRFNGTFSSDGRRIEGRAENSADGSQWELDFDLTYTKVK